MFTVHTEMGCSFEDNDYRQYLAMLPLNECINTVNGMENDRSCKKRRLCSDHIKPNSSICHEGKNPKNLDSGTDTKERSLVDPDYQSYMEMLGDGSPEDLGDAIDADFKIFLENLREVGDSYSLEMRDIEGHAMILVQYEEENELSSEIGPKTMITKDGVLSKGKRVYATKMNPETPLDPPNRRVKLCEKNSEENGVEDTLVEDDYLIFLKHVEIHNDSYFLEFKDGKNGKLISVTYEEENMLQSHLLATTQSLDTANGSTITEATSYQSQIAYSQRTNARKGDPCTVPTKTGKKSTLGSRNCKIFIGNAREYVQPLFLKSRNGEARKQAIGRCTRKNMSQQNFQKQTQFLGSGKKKIIQQDVANKKKLCGVNKSQIKSPFGSSNLRRSLRLIQLDEKIENSPYLAKIQSSLPTKSILLCQKLKVHEADDIRVVPSVDDSTNFKEELREIVEKPFDQNEYQALLSEATSRKPIKRLRNTRRRSTPYDETRSMGLSYLGRYPGFEEQMELATSHERQLSLLRWFFFWLKNACHQDAIPPWNRDPDSRCIVLDG